MLLLVLISNQMELGCFFWSKQSAYYNVQGFPCPGDIVATLFLLLKYMAASYIE